MEQTIEKKAEMTATEVWDEVTMRLNVIADLCGTDEPLDDEKAPQLAFMSAKFAREMEQLPAPNEVADHILWGQAVCLAINAMALLITRSPSDELSNNLWWFAGAVLRKLDPKPEVKKETEEAA